MIHFSMPRLTYLTIATLILLVAAVLRLAGLGELPPGPHYDEAANILITRSIAFDGANLFPVTPNYQGRESLYFYIVAPFFALIHDGAFSLRLVSAFANLITIAAAMTLGRLMIGGRRGVLVGLAAGVMMAVSFHQIFMARQAYRAVTLPMMQALGMVFLWRGLVVVRRGDSASHPYNLADANGQIKVFWRHLFFKKGGNGFFVRATHVSPLQSYTVLLWLALGGALSAGALYTYMSSRLFPLWLGVAALVLLWADRANWRARLRQGAVFFGALVVCALPMLIFALNQPDIFWGRLAEVQDGDVTFTLDESIRRHAEMFFIRGDDGNLRYNIPGRPYFTPIEAPLLVIGGLLALWGVFRAERPTQRAAYALIALAPLMIVPSVISVAGLPPSHMRSLGMVPLIFLMAGLGVAFILQRLPARAGLAGLIVALLVGAGMVGRDYQAWATRADLFNQTDADLASAAHWLNDHADGRPVYVSAYHREHPTVIALYAGRVTWLGLDSLILPPPQVEGVAIFSGDFPPPERWREYLTPVEDIPTRRDGEPAFGAYTVRADERPIPDSAIANPYITLIDATAEPIPAGASGVVMLTWRVNADVPFYGLRPVLRLVDPASGVELSASDPFLINTDTWRAGETIMQDVRLTAPPATPAGEYPLTVTWVDRASETFLTYVDDGGGSAGLTATFGTVRVTAPESPPVVTPDHPAAMTTGEGVRFIGWDALPEARRPGESLTIALYWEATPADARADFSVTATFGDTPLDAWTPAHPASAWRDGEINRTLLTWRIPRDTPSGDAVLTLTADDVELLTATVRVDGQPRLFQPPPVAEVIDALFVSDASGDRIALYGLDVTADGDALTVEIVWRADSAPATDYTVFVHLVDSAGVLRDQRDAMPQNYGYPTSLWDASEYVHDAYHFSVIARDIDAVRIGLYNQSTGERLYIFDAGDGIMQAEYYEQQLARRQ